MRRGRLAIAIAFVVLVGGLGGVGLVLAGPEVRDFAQGKWINSEPLTIDKLRGRVVLLDFWTYG